MKKDTAGAAFPISDSSCIHRIGSAAIDGVTDVDERDRIYTAATADAATGMSLRDYFAGQAVAGLLSQRLPAHQGEDGAETVAQDAYIVADAMLAERAK